MHAYARGDWTQTRTIRCLPAILSGRICRLLSRRGRASPSRQRSDENLRILGCSVRGDALAVESTPTPRLIRRAQPTPAWDYRMGYRLLLQSGWHQPHVATYTMEMGIWGRGERIYSVRCIPSLKQHQHLALRLSLSGICLYRRIIC